MYRVNIGCGMTPTAGWVNFDNSPSIRLARLPGALRLMDLFGALIEPQREYIRFCREHEIRWGDALRRIPLPDGSAEVVYSSHMLEHFDRQEAARFLGEAKRVLKPGGILRVSVPDIRRQALRYAEDGDADSFIASTCMAAVTQKTLGARLRYLFLGDRDFHHWMYDGESLTRTLEAAGFAEARVQPPGKTRIPDPGTLDLHERADESVYVEAVKP